MISDVDDLCFITVAVLKLLISFSSFDEFMGSLNSVWTNVRRGYIWYNEFCDMIYDDTEIKADRESENSNVLWYSGNTPQVDLRLRLRSGCVEKYSIGGFEEFGSGGSV